MKHCSIHIASHRTALQRANHLITLRFLEEKSMLACLLKMLCMCQEPKKGKYNHCKISKQSITSGTVKTDFSSPNLRKFHIVNILKENL